MQKKRKKILITGASRGLGAELAKAFSNANYDIFLIARSLDMLKKVKSSLNNDNVIIKECDLSQPTEIENLISEIKIHFEKIDVIINNAASHGPIGPFFENDIDAWENVFRLNLFAPMRLCFGLKENLRKSDFPSIINISGGGATGPRENLSAYATSKAGLVRFTETLAMELREEGIKVNAIAPGAMKTSLLKEVYDHGPDVTGKKEYLVAKDKFKSDVYWGLSPANVELVILLFESKLNS